MNRTFWILCVCLASSPAAALADMLSNPFIPAAEKIRNTEVYRFEVPDQSGGWNSAAIPYSVNNSLTTPSGYTRVTYYLELDNTETPANDFQYAYASFDVIPDLDTATELGVPSIGPNGSGKVIKASVANLLVYSNAAGAANGFFPTGGNLEFWPSDYGQGPDGQFNYDDNGFSGGGGHGSMQVHNGGLAQTLLGYSAWGTVRDSELGVGTNGSGSPDWTFATGNNDLFTIQTMQIFVIPEPTSFALAGMATIGLVAYRRRRR